MGSVISGFLLEPRLLDRKSREEGPVRKGFGTLAFTLFVVTILIAFYLVFVWSRLWVVNLGYRVSQALKEQKELVEVNKKLRVERATLISPERIDLYARQKLGMRDSQENQIRFVP